jgi:hypothetical protein
MIIKKPKTRRGPLRIDLTGPDGNAYVLLAIAKSLAEQLDKDWELINKDMTHSDYEHLVTAMDNHFGDYIVLMR